MCTCCDEGKVANVPLAHLPRCCDEGKAGNVLSWLGGQRKWECTQLAQLGPADSASPAQLLGPELGPAAQLAQLAQLGGSAEPAGPSWRHPAGVSWRQPPAGPARAAWHQLAQLAQLAQRLSWPSWLSWLSWVTQLSRLGPAGVTQLAQLWLSFNDEVKVAFVPLARALL